MNDEIRIPERLSQRTLNPIYLNSIPMPTLETDILADLIRAKRECLLQLRDLGRKQLELIDEGDMTALLDLLVREAEADRAIAADRKGARSVSQPGSRTKNVVVARGACRMCRATSSNAISCWPKSSRTKNTAKRR